ncbi:type IV toxin-antitoxin system AbiEi family antitoxin domain-containing protein [Cellulomonas sp. HZM]|uniref:type IV toxin-antitoxin system AbiEi family antitoxin domain-containing protein n=1 Tax=Cellulomonas sp. HZM TaxID=1454010 RepID=UPI00068DBAAE|nr:type IV toxin-antitoxin system AbiEi family antitoxin domain-containing protein [Cellulomonas sp. HZM]
MASRLHDIPKALAELARAQAGLLSAAQCDAAGVDRAARSRRVGAEAWTRPARGVVELRPPGSELGPDESRRRAAWLGLVAHPGSVAVGPAALALLGVTGLPLRIRPEVAFDDGRMVHSRAGIVVRQYDELGPTTALSWRRLVIGRTTGLRMSLVHAVPLLPRPYAVAVLDGLLARRRIDADDLDELRRATRGRRGAARSADVWDLADPCAESPAESVARVACHDAGIPPDELQVVIRDDHGRFVARGDLGWRLPGGRWLIAEIDGRQFHDTPVAVLADRERQNRLVASRRVELFRFAPSDATTGRLTTQLRAALDLHGWRRTSSKHLVARNGR